MAYGIADVKRNLRSGGTKENQANAAADQTKRKRLLRGAQQCYQRAMVIVRGLTGDPNLDNIKKEAEVGYSRCKKRLNKIAQAERKERTAQATMHSKEGLVEQPQASGVNKQPESPQAAKDAQASADAEQDPESPEQDGAEQPAEGAQDEAADKPSG